MFGCCPMHTKPLKVNPEISALSNYQGISTEARDNYIDCQSVASGFFS